MRKITAFILLLAPLFLYGHEVTLSDHSRIKEFSSFRMQGIVDLRTEKDSSAPVAYRTLNHEGGIRLSVLEVLDRDAVGGKDGRWLYVLLTSPLWVDTGEWMEAYHKFLIFLPDDMPVFDFEE